MINKYGSKLTDLLIHSLVNMKQGGILSATFNIPNDTISVADTEGTLTLHPIQYVDPDQIDNIAHYNYINSSEAHNDEILAFDASYSLKKKFKEISPGAITVGKDLHSLLNMFSKLPENPPMRDKAIFTKKEYYRKALLDHLEEIRNNEEFKFFRGTQRVESNQITGVKDLMSNQIDENSLDKVSIKVQEGSINNTTEDFKVIARKLAENIYQSVNMEVTEQISKEVSRRRELRIHVEMFKAYTRLQAFCGLNLSRGAGETTRSQAKTLVIRYYPHISVQNMSLMMQRAPRIYRLFLLSNGDWRFLDSFEELTSSFFKSSMKSAANFEIWLNLVKTGQLVDYQEGQRMRESGKQSVKEAKLHIIKDYFNEVNEEDLILDDDDDE